jgi:hypothetical protein
MLQREMRSRDSSVDIAKGYGLDGMGSIPGRGKGFFLFSTLSRPALSPPNLLSNGNRGYFLGDKAGVSTERITDFPIFTVM